MSEVITAPDRMRQCLMELGVELTGELRQLLPLQRLVSALIPDRREILSLRCSCNKERRRRAAADARVDKFREAIESFLCDGLSKNEAVRMFERLMIEMDYSRGAEDAEEIARRSGATSLSPVNGFVIEALCDEDD